MVEANAQLGLFKLPEDIFGKYEPVIRKALYNKMKDMSGGLDPRKEAKRLEI